MCIDLLAHAEIYLFRIACVQVLKINTDCKDIDRIKFEDLEIVGYLPHKKIEMKMAV